MRRVLSGSLVLIGHAAHEAPPSSVTCGHLPGEATPLPAACLAPGAHAPPSLVSQSHEGVEPAAPPHGSPGEKKATLPR